jgi:hypothetical protein
MSHIDSMWAGQTVAVLGNSPSLAQHLKQIPVGCKTIAASRAIDVYPQADMAVSIDGTTPEAYDGVSVVGVPAEPPAIYVGMWYERAELSPGHVIEFRNTGLLAIRVAAMTGASRIVLAGFDTDAYEARYYGQYPGITQAFHALVADLRGRGIEVVDLAQQDALDEILDGTFDPTPSQFVEIEPADEHASE